MFTSPTEFLLFLLPLPVVMAVDVNNWVRHTVRASFPKVTLSEYLWDKYVTYLRNTSFHTYDYNGGKMSTLLSEVLHFSERRPVFRFSFTVLHTLKLQT